MKSAEQLLLELYALIRSAQNSKTSIVDFDGPHEKQWERLSREVSAALRSEAKPN